MTRQLEAVFEHGVLRPVEPLSLPENQRVLLTIADVPAVDVVSSRQAEMEWLKANAHRYLGQWVALQGSELVSHGAEGRAVLDEARRKGVKRPLLYQVPEEIGVPSVSWL